MGASYIKMSWFHLIILLFATTGFSTASLQEDALAATNNLRSQHGEGKLELNSELTRAAEDWANKLARECKKGHRPFSSWPEEARGENIAYLCESNQPGKNAVNAWIDSPGHLENMLGSSHTVMGVGVAYSTGCRRHCRTTPYDPYQVSPVVVAMYGKIHNFK